MSERGCPEGVRSCAWPLNPDHGVTSRVQRRRLTSAAPPDTCLQLRFTDVKARAVTPGVETLKKHVYYQI